MSAPAPKYAPGETVEYFAHGRWEIATYRGKRPGYHVVRDWHGERRDHVVAYDHRIRPLAHPEAPKR